MLDHSTEHGCIGKRHQGSAFSLSCIRAFNFAVSFVDFVIGEELAVEVKASAKVGSSDFRGLRALQEEGMVKRLILVSQDPIAREKDGIRSLP